MRVRWLAALSCLLLASGMTVAACGDDDDEGGGGGGGGTSTTAPSGGGGKTLTVYSSLPLQGDSRPQSEDVVRGIELALEQAGGKAGENTIKYVSLDDATASTGKWEPGKVSENARKAVSDKNTIAYIGEFNSGASVISLPILNEAGILQVSPSNTYVGLTRAEGAEPGEPDKYYPSGKRTYGRVVPADHIQAGAQVSYHEGRGLHEALHPQRQGDLREGLGRPGRQDRRRAGHRGHGQRRDRHQGGELPLAGGQDQVGSVADGFFFGGITQNQGVQVFKDVAAANPDIKMFGPDGVAESAFSEKLGSKVEANVFITNPTLDPKEYPPAAQEFFSEFKAKHGKDPEPYAIYGYEAMNVAIEAIKAGGGDRQKVIDGFLAIKGRDSVLGMYDIDENGDTTLSDYGGNTIKGGKLVFTKVIKAATQ